MKSSEISPRYIWIVAIVGIAVIAVLCAARLGEEINVAEALTAIGTFLAAIGLGYAALQLRTSKIIARSEFVLRIYDMMQIYNDVHLRLTGCGKWSKDEGPDSAEEWMAVSRYMGLFEPIQLLLTGNLLDIKMIDVLYSHRVLAIVRNPVIFRDNLIKRSYRWEAFTDLWMILRSEYTFSSISKEEHYSENESRHAAVIMELKRSRKGTAERPPNPAARADC